MTRAIVPYRSYEVESDTDYYFSKYVDEPKLIQRCFQPISSFYKEGTVYNTDDGIYIHKDNGAAILAVAHLDTVISEKSWSRTGKNFYIPQLDDRLGVHILLDVLPKYGLTFDLLLTEGEEEGRSTAKHFVAEKQYNWMFEIDRSGDDAVMYQYETSEYRKLLKDAGFRVGFGSFTDISYLSSLNCFGVNFGCAYYNNHSKDAWLDLQELDDQLDKIIPFIRDNYNIYHKWDVSQYHTSRWSYGWYDDEYDAGYHRTRSVTETDWSKYMKKCPYCDTSSWRTSNYCTSCGCAFEDEVEECDICTATTCYGLAICELCGFEYHNDEYVYNFEFCKDCLQTIGVPWDLLTKYATSVDLTETDRYIEEIRSYFE